MAPNGATWPTLGNPGLNKSKNNLLDKFFKPDTGSFAFVDVDIFCKKCDKKNEAFNMVSNTEKRLTKPHSRPKS